MSFSSTSALYGTSACVTSELNKGTETLKNVLSVLDLGALLLRIPVNPRLMLYAVEMPGNDEVVGATFEHKMAF